MSNGIRILDFDQEEEPKEEGIRILDFDSQEVGQREEGIQVLTVDPPKKAPPVWKEDDPRIQLFQETNNADIADFERGTGLTLRDAYAKVDAISSVMKMTGAGELDAATIVEASRLAWGSKPVNIADLSDKLKDAYNTQRISIQVADIYNQMGQVSPDEPSGRPQGPGDVLGAQRTKWDDYRDQIKQLRSTMPAQTYSDNATFMEKSLIGLTQQLPIWLDMAEGAGRLALPVAITLGGLSVATGGVALPAFIPGVTAAAAIGGANEMSHYIRGVQFGEFMDLEDENGNTMDPRRAWAWASLIGAGEAALEIAQLGLVYSSFAGRAAKRAAKSAMGRAMTRLTSDPAFNNIVTRSVGRVAVGTASESAEEGVQKVWSLLGEHFAKEISNDKDHTEFQQTTFQEGLKAAWDETTNAAVSFWLTQIPGGIHVAARSQVKAPIEAKGVDFEVTDALQTEDEMFMPEGTSLVDVDADLVAEQEEIDAVRSEADAFTPEARAEIATEDVQVIEGEPAVSEDQEVQDLNSNFVSGQTTWEDISIEVPDAEFTQEERIEKGLVARGETQAVAPDIGEFEEEAAGRVLESEVIEQPRESVKARVQRETGLTDETELTLTEKQALKARVAAEARGSREGVAEGKRVKATQEKVKKEKAKQRKYFKDTAEYITKDRRAAPINIAQKRAIAALSEGIEPRFFNSKTIYENDALKKHLERHPEDIGNIPKKRLLKAMNKPLNEFTVAEIEERAQLIADLEKEGRMVQVVRDKVAKMQHDATVNTLVSTMLKGAESVEQTELGGSLDKRNKALTPENVRAATLNIQRILDSWDNYQDFQGPAHDVFWNAVQDSTDNRLRNTKGREKVARAKRQELNIDMGDMTKPIEKGNDNYTRDDVLSMYMLMQNEKGAAALVHGNKLTVKQITGYTDKLTEEEKAWGDWIIEHGYEDHYDRVNEAFVEYTTAQGKPQDMGYEDRYSPMNRMSSDGGSFLKDLQEEALERAALRDAYAAKGFTMDRIEEIKPEHQTPVRLGATREFFSQIKKQENFIANAKSLRDFHKIVNDKKFAAAVKQHDGGTARLDALKGFINTQAEPNYFANMDESAKGLKKLVRQTRQKVATAALGYNLRTMAQTLPSSVLMMPESGVKNYVWGMTQFAAHPVETQQLMQAQPQIAARSLDRMMEEMQSQNPAGYKKLMQKNGKAAFMGLWLFDRMAITPGWMGVYHKFKLKGETDTVAAREATSAIGRTQVGGSSKDVAGMYRTDDEFIASALQFTTQLSQIYQMMSYDIPANAARGVRAIKEGDVKGFVSAFAKSGGAGLAIAASNAMIWTIKHGRPPKDDDDVKDMVLTGLANQLPVVGSDVAAGVMGYDDQGNPVEDIANQFGKVVGSKPGMNTTKRFSWLAEKLAMGVFGYPAIQIKRTKKFFESGKLIDLIGGVKK